MELIQKLQFNLQEKTFPFFSQEELEYLLEKNNNDLEAASYEGCLLKAQDDSFKMDGIDIPSQKKYWISLAKRYRKNASGTMKRADES